MSPFRGAQLLLSRGMQTCSPCGTGALPSPPAPATSTQGTCCFPEPFADALLPDPLETRAEKLIGSCLGKGPGRAGIQPGECCLFCWPCIICQQMMIASNAFIV